MQHTSDFFHAAWQADVAILTLVDTANPQTTIGEASLKFRSDLTNLLDTYQPAKILVDFAGLSRIGSLDLGNAPMIAILLASRKRKASHGSQWRLCGLPDEIRERYVLAHLDKIFPIHQTPSEAIAAFQSV